MQTWIGHSAKAIATNFAILCQMIQIVSCFNGKAINQNLCGIHWVAAGHELGSRLFGYIPSRKYQDGGMALQDMRQGLGPLDAQIDGVGFNG